MEIPKLELNNKKLKNRDYSVENTIGYHLDTKQSAFNVRCCSSEEVKSTDTTIDSEQDGAFKSFSAFDLFRDRPKSPAWKGVVYFQEINARVVFSEDYKCRIGQKKNKIDFKLRNLFAETKTSYTNLIAHTKKKQQCSACVSEKCYCGDANNVLMRALARNGIKSKVKDCYELESHMQQKAESIKKPDKLKPKKQRVVKKKNIKKKVVIDETELVEKKAILQLNAAPVAGEIVEMPLERKEVNTLASAPKKLADVVPEELGIIPEVLENKTASTDTKKKKKPKKLCRNCRMSMGKDSNHHKLTMADAASSTPPRNLKEQGTNPRSLLACSECTQTCCSRKLPDHNLCRIRTTTDSIIEKRKKARAIEKPEILVFLDDLIEEFDKQYERETKLCEARKKKESSRENKEMQTIAEARSVNYTHAYSTLIKQCMRFVPDSTYDKMSVKNTNARENDLKYTRLDANTHENEKLLKCLTTKRTQFSYVADHSKGNFSLTQEDQRKFEEEFYHFLVRSRTR